MENKFLETVIVKEEREGNLKEVAMAGVLWGNPSQPGDMIAKVSGMTERELFLLFSLSPHLNSKEQGRIRSEVPGSWLEVFYEQSFLKLELLSL